MKSWAWTSELPTTWSSPSTANAWRSSWKSIVSVLPKSIRRVCVLIRRTKRVRVESASWRSPAQEGNDCAEDIADRRQRNESRHAFQAPGSQGVSSGHCARRDAGPYSCASGKPGIDPDGHWPARYGWLGGYASPQSQQGYLQYSNHRPDRACAGYRSSEGI